MSLHSSNLKKQKRGRRGWRGEGRGEQREFMSLLKQQRPAHVRPSVCSFYEQIAGISREKAEKSKLARRWTLLASFYCPSLRHKWPFHRESDSVPPECLKTPASPLLPFYSVSCFSNAPPATWVICPKIGSSERLEETQTFTVAYGRLGNAPPLLICNPEGCSATLSFDMALAWPSTHAAFSAP